MADFTLDFLNYLVNVARTLEPAFAFVGFVVVGRKVLDLFLGSLKPSGK